jgi:phage I-like protein
MAPLTLATCDRALPPGDGAPEWVHLLPAGHMTGRDGRSYSLPDPAALILAFQEGGIDLPVDYEHQSDMPAARQAGPIPAAGWIKELRHNEEGLWGRVEWTATARQMIGAKEYRFLSPVFYHNRARQIMRLKGAGLVHAPNLYLKALASQEPPMRDPKAPVDTAAKTPPETSARSPLLERLMKLLKFGPDATEEQALDALEAWLADREANPDPRKFVPVEAVAHMLQERRLEKAVMSEGQIVAKVDAAVSTGHILPGLRSWALSLCRSDPTAFDEFMAKTGAIYTYLGREIIAGVPPGVDHARQIAPTDAEAAICAQLGIKPERLSRG